MKLESLIEQFSTREFLLGLEMDASMFGETEVTLKRIRDYSAFLKVPPRSY